MSEEPQRVDQYGDPIPAGAFCRIGTGRLRHTVGGNGFFNALEFSPDGKILASGAKDECSICLWEVATGKLLHRFEIKRQFRLFQLSFSRSGHWLIAQSDDAMQMRTRIWNVIAGREFLPRLLRNARCAAFSPDEQFLALAESNKISVYSVRTRRQVYAFVPDDKRVPVHWVSFPCQTTFCAATSQGILICNIESKTYRNLIQSDKGNIRCVVSPDNTLLAASIWTSQNDQIRLWELPSGDPIEPIPYTRKNDSVDSLAFSSDSRDLAFTYFYYCAGQAGTSLYQWQIGSNMRPKRINDLVDWQHQYQLTSDKRFVLAINEKSGDVENIHVYDLLAKRTHQRFPTNPAPMKIAVTPQSDIAATVSREGPIRLFARSPNDVWNPLDRNGKELLRMLFTDDDRWLLTHEPGVVRIHELRKGRHNCLFDDFQGTPLALSANSRFLAFHRQQYDDPVREIEIVETISKERWGRIHIDGNYCIAKFRKDNKTVAVWKGGPQPILLYDLHGKKIGEISWPPKPTGRLGLNDNRFLALETKTESVMITVLCEDQHSNKYPKPKEINRSVWSELAVCMSHDGERIMCLYTNWDDRLWSLIWERRTKKLKKSFPFAFVNDNYSVSMSTATFSSKKRCLVACIEPGAIPDDEVDPPACLRVWDVSAGEKIFDCPNIDVLETGRPCETGVQLSPRGKYLAVTCDNRLLLWKTSDLLKNHKLRRAGKSK